MNFLSIFVLIPLLMLAGLWAARGIKARSEEHTSELQFTT